VEPFKGQSSLEENRHEGRTVTKIRHMSGMCSVLGILAVRGICYPLELMESVLSNFCKHFVKSMTTILESDKYDE
jgi:hypothetical protein